MVASARLKAVVIEDNSDLKDMLVEDLNSAGYDAVGFGSCEDYEADQKPADIFLLDVNLPGQNGLDFARELRSHDRRVGIIVLSVRFGSESRTTGYQNGADIYLQKPCGSDEIAAAMDRVAERVRLQGAGREGVWHLSLVQLSLTLGSEMVPLKQREAEFLAALALANDRQLAYAACKPHFAEGGLIGQSALEVAVGRLRKKIETVTGISRAIVSVRGFGYRLLLDVIIEG